jgi:protein gp37
MSGLSVSRGNMYDWVTHVWSPLVGCPHQCSYCYVRSNRREQPASVTVKEGWPPLGRDRTIFVGHLCDMFAEAVPGEVIETILAWCRRFPNHYVFQSKNPQRFRCFDLMPEHSMFGTTIETNRQDVLDRLSKAPSVFQRAVGLLHIKSPKFLTIEPILDFDADPLVDLIATADPDFVNIGADSKRHGLPEPSRSKVMHLVDLLQEKGIAVRKKINLERLMR